MQFDIQKRSEGGKISHLIKSADDRGLRGAVRADAALNAATADQITENKRL